MLVRQLAAGGLAACGLAAGGLAACGLAAHGLSACEAPHPAVVDARRKLHQKLGVRDAPTGGVVWSVKSGHISARIILAPTADPVSVLMPLLARFPSVTWDSQAAQGVIGSSLLLQPPVGSASRGAPSCSLFVPDPVHGRGMPAELEMIGGDERLSDDEADALADALVASRVTAQQPRPRASRGTQSGGAGEDAPGLRSELFRVLPMPGGGGGPGGGGHGGGPGGRGGTPVERLEALGLEVRMPGDGRGDAEGWDDLAGSEATRAVIEENLVLPLRHPALFAEVARATGSARRGARAEVGGGAGGEARGGELPSAVLMTGPPGTGKTSTARILAAELGRPMVYLPLEKVVSKWYGEAEQRLAAVFDACAELGPAVLFLDEIDALAARRDAAGMHEATRRSLSVLLRKLDGFQSDQTTVLLAATNRPQDLDAALLSRFGVTVRFPLPPLAQRRAIFARYARQLDAPQLDSLALAAEGASGRDIRDVCSAAARRWAARRVRGEACTTGAPLPPLAEYESALQQRRGAAREGGGIHDATTTVSAPQALADAPGRSGGSIDCC